jgi:hypothetical protein
MIGFTNVSNMLPWITNIQKKNILPSVSQNHVFKDPLISLQSVL